MVWEQLYRGSSGQAGRIAGIRAITKAINIYVGRQCSYTTGTKDKAYIRVATKDSVNGRATFGPNAGKRMRQVGDPIEPEDMQPAASPRCARVSGFSLHANTATHAGDRARLERLLQYCAVAIQRLQTLPDGRLRYELKRKWNNGTTYVVFHPLELLEKLAALVPAPRTHLVRYSGVLAPAAKSRSRIVAEAQLPAPREEAAAVPDIDSDSASALTQTAWERNYSWAELMKRVWSIDVLECPRCQGRMRLPATIHSPVAIRKILDCLGLPSVWPEIMRAIGLKLEPARGPAEVLVIEHAQKPSEN